MSETNRLVVLDTETTGLRANGGDRVVEIGCVEIVDGVPTGRTFHEYLNPEGKRNDEATLKVHGLTDEFLSKQKKFGEIAPEFLRFIKGAELIIHNADFDVTFLNAELDRRNMGQIWDHCGSVSCSLKMAQSKWIGSKNNLDAICARLKISTEHRTLHGALLDAELLAEAYLAMVKDGNPFIDDEELAKKPRPAIQRLSNPGLSFAAVVVPEANKVAHEAFLDALEADTKSPSIWRGEAATASRGMRM